MNEAKTTFRGSLSGVALRHAEGSGGAAALRLLGCFGESDGTVRLLIFHDVVLQRIEEALGMLGRQNDAALHVGFRQTGKHADEVKHYFGAGVSDDGEVGIDALSHFGSQFNFQLTIVLVLIFHDDKCLGMFKVGRLRDGKNSRRGRIEQQCCSIFRKTRAGKAVFLH